MKHGLIDRYRDLLELPADLQAVSLGEGDTPLLPLELGIGREVFVKYEGCNPTGSFKDRGMTVAVSMAKRDGAHTVICASTGNTAASAAAYAGRGRMRALVVVPDGHVALGKLSQAGAAGAQVVQLAGNFDAALRMVRQVSARLDGVALVNSVNPWRLVGQRTGAFEIVEALGEAPDLLALPVGNAGNITAYGAGFRTAREYGLSHREPKLLGFQAAGAAPLVLGHDVEEPETLASAIRIGRPASAELAKQAVASAGGGFWAVTDEEILESWRLLASHGIFVEPASASGVAGIRKLHAQGQLPAGQRIVCILTGHGLKDPERAIKVMSAPTRLPAQSELLEELLVGGVR